jgi:hypothetical protein
VVLLLTETAVGSVPLKEFASVFLEERPTQSSHHPQTRLLVCSSRTGSSESGDGDDDTVGGVAFSDGANCFISGDGCGAEDSGVGGNDKESCCGRDDGNDESAGGGGDEVSSVMASMFPLS